MFATVSMTNVLPTARRRNMSAQQHARWSLKGGFHEGELQALPYNTLSRTTKRVTTAQDLISGKSGHQHAKTSGARVKSSLQDTSFACSHFPKEATSDTLVPPQRVL